MFLNNAPNADNDAVRSCFGGSKKRPL